MDNKKFKLSLTISIFFIITYLLIYSLFTLHDILFLFIRVFPIVISIIYLILTIHEYNKKFVNIKFYIIIEILIFILSGLYYNLILNIDFIKSIYLSITILSIFEIILFLYIKFINYKINFFIYLILIITFCMNFINKAQFEMVVENKNIYKNIYIELGTVKSDIIIYQVLNSGKDIKSIKELYNKIIQEDKELCNDKIFKKLFKKNFKNEDLINNFCR